MNRDRRTSDNVSLDTLTNAERARYHAGDWIGRPVTSAELRGSSRRDPHSVAELLARIDLMRERGV